MFVLYCLINTAKSKLTQDKLTWLNMIMDDML